MSAAMPSLTDILGSAGRCLTETEVWCVLYSSLKFLASSSRDVGSSLISTESLFIDKGKVRFLSGAQSTTAATQECSASEEEIQFLGQVLSTAMDAGVYSQELLATINRMTDDHDSEHTQDITYLIKESFEWIKKQSNIDGELSVNGVLEKLSSYASVEVGSTYSDFPMNNNLAEEFEAVEQSNRFSTVDSGGSSISLSSRGSFYEDGMSRSDSHHSNVSDLFRRRTILSQSSSNEQLSDSINKKSQFYTPVRSRKTRLSGDKSSLPPLPRPALKKTARLSDGDPISPLKNNIKMEDFPPELPPKKYTPRHSIESDTVADDISQETDQTTPLKSLQEIQHILESSSAPDLLEVNYDDVFNDTSNVVPDDSSTDNIPPPTPPATLPPANVSLSSTDVPHTTTVSHHETIHSVNDTAAIITPSSPPNPVIGETTFDYTDMSPIKNNISNVSNGEFQLTPPPVPLHSPPKSDNETEPSSPPVPVILSETITENDYHVYEAVQPPSVNTIQVIRHDEFGYALPHHVKRRLTDPKEEEFEHTQTLDRQKSKLMVEEMMKAPSEGDVIPQIAPSLHTPERYSMPDPGYELIDINQSSKESIDVHVIKTETTSFIDQQENKETNTPQSVHEDIENTDKKPRKRKLTFVEIPSTYHSHKVIVHCPSDIESEPIEVGVRPDSTCKDLFNRIVRVLDIDEDDSFGVGIMDNNEIMFMEPTKKIYKYAPSKKWRKQKTPQPFRVYFRVMFYFKNPALMRKPETRMIHYNQVKNNIISGRVHVPDNIQLILATLSLIVDGKRIPNTASTDQSLFTLEEYMSKQAIIDNGGKERTYCLVCQMHLRCVKMTPERAVFCYLKEALKIDELTMTFYAVTMGKKEQAYLGFSPNGLWVCQQNQNNKDIIQHCMWKGTTDISCSNQKFMVTVDGNDPLTLKTTHYKRARYFVTMSRFYHQFSRQMRGRTPITSLQGLEDDEMKRFVEGNTIEIKEYEGQVIEQKLLKDETNSLGITLMNHTSPGMVDYVEVERVTKDRPAYQAKCPKPGDLILEVNSINMIWKSHSEVGIYLKNSPPLVELTIFRRIDEDCQYTHEYNGELVKVSLERDAKFGQGFSVKSHTTPKNVTYCQVTRVKENSPADKEGCPKEGDLIVSVNGKNVVGINHKEIGLKLKKMNKTIITVLRYLPLSNYPKSPEQTDSFRTIEVQYTGDEVLSSGQPLEESASKDTSGSTQDPLGSPEDHLGLTEYPLGLTQEPTGMTKRASLMTLDKHSTLSSENGPALPMSPNDVRTVVLRKHNSTFGFAISGRSSNPYRSIYINKITPGGPAEMSQLLEIGDHILSVNRQSVEGQSYNEVFKLLRSLADEVELQVCSPDDDSGRITIELDRNKGQLGLRINRTDDGNIVVVGVIKGSEADKTGLIHAGSEILQVNGTSFYGLSAREATDVLINCSSPLYVLLKSSDSINQQKFNYNIKENTIPETGETSSPEQSPSLDKRPIPKLSPSEDKRSSPKQSPSQDKRPILKLSPSQDKRRSPKLSTSQDKRPSPKASPSQNKKPSPKASPSQNKRPSSKLSPSQDKRPSPKLSPSQDKRPSPKLSASQDKRSSPKASPSQEKRPSPKLSHGNIGAFEQLTIALKKGAKGFGFKIRKDPPAERENNGLYIASIDFDPAKSDGRLQVGDEIIKINGENLVGVTHQKGVQTMRSVVESGVLTIRRKRLPQENDEDEEILEELKHPTDNYSSLKKLIATRQENNDNPPLSDEISPILQTIEEDYENNEVPPSSSTTLPTIGRPSSAISDGPPPPLPLVPPPPLTSRPSSIIVSEDIVIVTMETTPSPTDEDTAIAMETTDNELAPVPT